MGNAAIEKALKTKMKIAEEFCVSPSAVVWIGNNNYIVVKDGSEIKVSK